MDKKFYETPKMEEIELKNVSMICANEAGDPDYDPDPAEW